MRIVNKKTTIQIFCKFKELEELYLGFLKMNINKDKKVCIVNIKK